MTTLPTAPYEFTRGSESRECCLAEQSRRDACDSTERPIRTDRRTQRHGFSDPAELNLREVLAEKSKLLPKNIFDTPDLWHSHHGYIDKCEANSPYEVLENINVNMLDTNGQRSIQILTSHRAQLKTPIWTYDNFSSGLDQYMPQLHERNKSILRDLLMPEVQAMIKLKS